MIHHFELVTVQIVDVAGLEGVGYAYTVGTNGAAVRSLIADDLRPLVGVASDEIKAVWQKMCWRSGGARVARSRAQL
jgi:L-alanine-DL-glutamate epimerase-like enolase superfamily enzyme